MPWPGRTVTTTFHVLPAGRRSTAVNVFCLSAAFAEYVFYGPSGSLGAVADAQLAVQVAELSLDRIFADVQMFTELAIGHTGRKQREQLALPLGEAGLSSGPVDLAVEFPVL